MQHQGQIATYLQASELFLFLHDLGLGLVLGTVEYDHSVLLLPALQDLLEHPILYLRDEPAQPWLNEH